MTTSSRRATVRCLAVRWVSDEPQPGWIEYRLTDVDGMMWSFFDKPIHGGWEAMTPTADYPRASWFACEIVRTETDAQGAPVIVISTLQPDGLKSSEGRSEFRVRKSQIG